MQNQRKHHSTTRKTRLSDYRIGRKINTDPPSVTRSRKNARKKLLNAVRDLEWAEKMGVLTSS